jgi:hypothetical protein
MQTCRSSMPIVPDRVVNTHADAHAPLITPAAGRADSVRLSVDPDTFAQDFDKRPFYVKHALADHPLLELSAMAALSQRLPGQLLEWNSGQAGAFTQPDKSKPHRFSCSDTILAVAERPAWILLLQIEHDLLYKRLADELLDGIQPLSEPIRPGMCQRRSFLFISSREAFTPFHFDPDYNFLLQVRGHKTIYMWDPADRSVLPASAIDNYYAGIGGDPRYSNRNQQYRDEFMASAWKLPMKAGEGVHFPLHAPHAVKTESDVSISLSITFRTRRSQFNAMVHGANGHVRRLGIKPPAPGVSRQWDVAANVGFRGVRRTVALAKRIMLRSG